MTASSSRPTILVVEDEWLIADMIEHALAQAGYRILGPACSVAQALRLIAAGPCDAALLDVNLGAEKSFVVIDRLIALGIPHLLITGYCPPNLPERYRRCPRLSKPLLTGALIEAVRTLAPRAG